MEGRGGHGQGRRQGPEGRRDGGAAGGGGGRAEAKRRGDAQQKGANKGGGGGSQGGREAEEGSKGIVGVRESDAGRQAKAEEDARQTADLKAKKAAAREEAVAVGAADRRKTAAQDKAAQDAAAKEAAAVDAEAKKRAAAEKRAELVQESDADGTRP